MLLAIGNKNYSSWSLRPWLAMKVLGIAFEEKRILLERPDTRAQILKYSPANRAYAEAVLALPAMREWIAAAEREPESIPQLDLPE